MTTYELIANSDGTADIVKLEDGRPTYFDYESVEEAEQDMWSLRDFHSSNPDVAFLGQS